MGKLFVGITVLIASGSFFTPVYCHKNHAASTEKSIFWERESQFSLKVWPLVGWWQPSGWLYICEYMGNKNWTQWAIKIKESKIEYEVEMCRRMWRGYGRPAGTMIKTHYMHTWNFRRVNKCCVQMHLFFKLLERNWASSKCAYKNMYLFFKALNKAGTLTIPLGWEIFLAEMWAQWCIMLFS